MLHKVFPADVEIKVYLLLLAVGKCSQEHGAVSAVRACLFSAHHSQETGVVRPVPWFGLGK